MTRKEFIKAAGINNRQRLQQLMRGYNKKGKFIQPILVNGVDFKELEFFPSALEKLNKGEKKS